MTPMQVGGSVFSARHDEIDVIFSRARLPFRLLLLGFGEGSVAAPGCKACNVCSKSCALR